MANIKSIGGNPIVLGLDGLTDEAKATLGSASVAAGALIGSDGTESTWAQRVTTGDGAATIEKLLGNTVVWNQLYYRSAGSATVRGVTYTIDANGLITLNGTVAETGYILGYALPVTAGHKYLACGHGGNFDVNKATFELQVSGGADNSNSGLILTAASGTTQFAPAICFKHVGDVLTNVTFRPQIFDLTQMFGAGNEPSTVAEFEALFPEAYYPYDAGSLLSVNIGGVASSGDGWTAEHTIPVADYFSNGMRSAGTVRDELSAGAAVTRIGSVDLGTLTWVQNNDTPDVFYAAVSGIYVPSAQSGRIDGLVASKYYTVDTLAAIGPTMTQKTMKRSYGNVYIRDESYATAAAFKTAMSGVYLFYELATPTTQTIDPPLNLTYRVERGGTESVMVPTGEQTAPPVMDVAYGGTKESIIADALSAIAAQDGPTATANHSVGTYLTMGGTLYKVTSAIASGEAIVPGTNVTATTVMAEVIALTQ